MVRIREQEEDGPMNDTKSIARNLPEGVTATTVADDGTVTLDTPDGPLTLSVHADKLVTGEPGVWFVGAAVPFYGGRSVSRQATWARIDGATDQASAQAAMLAWLAPVLASD
jgi:hypothetical protein